jgi:DNA-binding protein HU-beta
VLCAAVRLPLKRQLATRAQKKSTTRGNTLATKKAAAKKAPAKKAAAKKAPAKKAAAKKAPAKKAAKK